MLAAARQEAGQARPDSGAGPSQAQPGSTLHSRTGAGKANGPCLVWLGQHLLMEKRHRLNEKLQSGNFWVWLKPTGRNSQLWHINTGAGREARQHLLLWAFLQLPVWTTPLLCWSLESSRAGELQKRFYHNKGHQSILSCILCEILPPRTVTCCSVVFCICYN